MQKILAILTPQFLRKMDHYLLLNYPRFWGTRFHYFIFYGLLTNIAFALFALAFFHPGSLRDFSAQPIWIVIFIEAVIFIFWLYIQSLFSVEKEYGNTPYGIGLIETIINAICISLIFAPSLVMLGTGVYKVAYLDTTEKNVCIGPRLLDFYSASELNNSQSYFDLNKMQKVLRLAQNTVNSGIVVDEDDIFIGLDAVRPEAKRFEILETNNTANYYSAYDASSVSKYKTEKIIKIIVEDGTATIIVLGEEATIKHRNPIPGIATAVIVKYKEQVTVNTGDEISYEHPSNDSQDTTLQVVSGKITIRRVYENKIEKNQVFIAKKGEEIELVMGDATLLSDEGAWFFDSTSTYEFCKRISSPSYNNQHLGRDSKNHDIEYYFELYFNFLLFAIWHALFILLGIFFTQILKHSNWRILIFSFLYSGIFFAIFYVPVSNIRLYSSSLPPIDLLKDYDISKPMMAILIVLAAVVVSLAIFQSARLIKTQRYNPFGFINFLGLPIALGSLGFLVFIGIIGSLINIYTEIKLEINNVEFMVLMYLIIFFTIYLLFTPIQKRVLIYLMSLPKE